MSQQLVRDTLENNDIFWQILPVVMGERTPVQSYIPKKRRFFRAIRQMVRDLLGMMTAGPELLRQPANDLKILPVWRSQSLIG